MIDVSRLAGRAPVARVQSRTTQLLVAPGQSATASPKVTAGLLRVGVAARLDLSGVLRLRLPRLDGGAPPSAILDRVKRARALLAARRQAAEEAELAALDAAVATLEAALAGDDP